MLRVTICDVNYLARCASYKVNEVSACFFHKFALPSCEFHYQTFFYAQIRT